MSNRVSIAWSLLTRYHGVTRLHHISFVTWCHRLVTEYHCLRIHETRRPLYVIMIITDVLVPNHDRLPVIDNDSSGTGVYNGSHKPSLVARLMGPTWGPYGADRTQVGPMLSPWTLLSGIFCNLHIALQPLYKQREREVQRSPTHWSRLLTQITPYDRRSVFGAASTLHFIYMIGLATWLLSNEGGIRLLVAKCRYHNPYIVTQGLPSLLMLSLPAGCLTKGLESAPQITRKYFAFSWKVTENLYQQNCLSKCRRDRYRD